MGIIPEDNPITQLMDLAKASQDTPIQDQIASCLEEARKTGKRIKLQFRKEEIARESLFDDLLTNPLTTSFSKDVVILDIAPLTELSVGELGQLCLDAGHENKLAMHLAGSLQHKGVPFDSSQSVSILTQDLNAIKAAGKNTGATPIVSSLPPKDQSKKEPKI